MPRALPSEDPLLPAIAALRQEVDRLIDEQIALVTDKLEEVATSRIVLDLPKASQRVGQTAAGVPRERRNPPRGEVDPKQRLDALAKRLDGRMRRAGNRSETPPAE